MKRIILFLCVILFSVFSNTSKVLAKDISQDLDINTNNKIEEINPNKNKETDISNSSIDDIFGDEQTFPFVAGLGKNAAH